MRLAIAVSLFAVAVQGFAPSAHPVQAAGLRLNEFMAGPARDWDGSGAFSSRDDEWVEIRNDDMAPLDLTGYLVTDGDSIPRLALSGSLAAGERRVLFGIDSYNWERAQGYPAFGFSLANGGDAVILWQVQGADTVVVDAYAYRAHEGAADRSVGRANDDGAWILFDALNPYTGTTPPAGSSCAPSPGAINLCSATPVPRTSWGRLKSLYR